MTQTVFAADISNYTGYLSPEATACLRAAGIEHVILRASLEPGKNRVEIARQQMDALTAAGIDWSVYVWCYPASWDARTTIRDTVTLLEGRPCRWFHLDVEDVADAPGPGATARWLTIAINELLLQGRRPSIYTGRWFWEDPRYLGDIEQFSDIPLWTAEYDGRPDLTRWTKYGGWETLLGKQYAGSGQQALCGLSCDLNVFDAAILTPKVEPAPPPVPPMPPLPPTPRDPNMAEISWGLVDKVYRGQAGDPAAYEDLARDAGTLAGHSGGG